MIWVTAAWAEAPEDVVVVAAPVDPGGGASQVTVVELADLPDAADLADAVQRAPGVVVRRLGGVGDLAQVGIRGAGARQSEILVDGIPLNPEGGSAVDLSELPPSAFQRVEVYRGAAPALLGTTALGGAIALIPADGDLWRSTLSVGSFGTGRASATAGVSGSAGHLLLNLDGLTTAGTFRYWDDRGTRFVPGDDRIAIRENNDTGQLTTLVDAWTERAGVRWSALYTGLAREQGVPGFTSAPSPTVRYGVQRHLVGLRATGTRGAAELGARAFLVDRQEQLSDPSGEIGVGAQETRDRSDSAGVDLWTRAAVTGPLRVDASAGGRGDRYASTDRLTGVEGPEQRRWTGKAALAAPLVGSRLEAVPSIVALALTDPQDPSDVVVLALPRVGAALRGGVWTLKANAGAFARPPDLVELYGDRGALIGNPLLRPERGLQLDLGPTLQTRSARLEVVGFLARTRDLIAWSVGAQGVARPENIDRADVFGLELAAEWTAGPWVLGGNATAMVARNRSSDLSYAGNQLPRVPLVEALGRAGLRGGRWDAGVDGSFTAGTFADSANLVPQPARGYLGATLALRPRPGIGLELDLRNVLDTISARVPPDPLVDDGTRVQTAVVDFTGYPLPGRTLTATVQFGDR